MLISNSSFVATIGSGVISSEDSKFHVPAAVDIPQAKARTAGSGSHWGLHNPLKGVTEVGDGGCDYPHCSHWLSPATVTLLKSWRAFSEAFFAWCIQRFEGCTAVATINNISEKRDLDTTSR